MAAATDYGALRALALDSGGDDEAVTVNTRALIDKVLARYSGEWTTLRELIQNAADAMASKVTIRFETLPSSTVPTPRAGDPSAAIKHVCLHHTLRRLVVSNDGNTFIASDWARLKRIAEGNPDETKIGAFGVGFYSVFADCEEPLVRSGKEALAFYWKGNSLFTRRLLLPPSQVNSAEQPETAFILDYRNTTSPIPGLLSLSQFLASSLTFVGLQAIELWLDDWKILSLAKKPAPSRPVPIPFHIHPKTKEDVMEIINVEREVVQIDATWMKVVGWKPSQAISWNAFNSGGSDSIRGFFSRLSIGPLANNTSTGRAGRELGAPQETAALEELTSTDTAAIFLYLTNADVRSTVSGLFAQELERATKKYPPRTTKVAVLTSLYQPASSTPSKDSVDIFGTVLPKLSGKIFIGFPTAQTTGLLAHISAPSVIPTVERESIDLNARYVKTWNVELLRATGIVCRIAWTCEMNALQEKLLRMEPENKTIEERAATLIPEAIHIFRQFTFHESTPSAQVGQLIEEAFWTSRKEETIELFASRGVSLSHQVRLSLDEVSGFISGLPVIPREIENGAPDFVNKLKAWGLLTEVSISDVRQELENQSLNEKQLREFVAWCARRMTKKTMDADALRSVMSIAVASWDGNLYVMREVKYFLNASRIPVELPYPPETAPFSCTRALSRAELEALGWKELQIHPWLTYLVEQSGAKGSLPPNQDITQSASFSAQVLPVVSKSWDSLDQETKKAVIGLLQDRTVMPTRLGMRKPTESYFPSVKLFQDLPIVTGLNSVKEKLLMALGVRKTIELSIIFDRLLAPNESLDAKGSPQKPKWSHVDLIRYLVSVANDIPADDMERLRRTAICPAEDRQSPTVPSEARFKVSELYEPREVLRGLGLPLLHWPTPYRSGSPEGGFLKKLGLQAIPSGPDLINGMIQAAKNGEPALHNRLMLYFTSNYHTNGYSPCSELASSPYLPAEGGGLTEYVSPESCFSNGRAAVFGFVILRNDLYQHAPKFGVRKDPPVDDCLTFLTNTPPQTWRDAYAKFSYMSTRLGELSQERLNYISNMAFIPIFAAGAQHSTSTAKQAPAARFQTPRMCFLGDSGTYGEILDFVDFGFEAQAFLVACGAKDSPSEKELAALISREPARVLGTLQADKYMQLLRNLATNVPKLKTDKALWKTLKAAPCLLAFKYATAPSEKANTLKPPQVEADMDDEEPEKEWQLARAGNIVLNDDVLCFSLFKDRLLTAPTEDVLEGFYFSLGASTLSSLVEAEPSIGAVISGHPAASELKRLVDERSRIFLYEYTSEQIKHDARWLEKNLKVEAVKSISLRRSLKGYNAYHHEKRTAALIDDGRKGTTLWITANGYDLVHVSQALVGLLLMRPKKHSTMMLEMILSTDLRGLRSRGYNVNRILRAKEAQARIAEDQRRKQLEEEERLLRASQLERQRSKLGVLASAASTQAMSTSGKPSTPKPRPKPAHEFEPDFGSEFDSGLDVAVPGAFVDSPPSDSEKAPVRPSRRGLFSTLSRRLGLDDNSSSGSGAASPLPSTATAVSTGTTDTQQKPPQAQPRPQPRDVQATLTRAIQAARPHDAAQLFSPARTSLVQESSSYCDASPGQDMVLYADALLHSDNGSAGTDAAAGGTKLFFARHLASGADAFVAAQRPALELFAGVLRDCSRIYALAPASVHVFCDDRGASIAFNRQGSIFCNFRFFQQLHLRGMLMQQPQQQPQQQQQQQRQLVMPTPEGIAQAVAGGARAEALVYWFVVLAHELAHNIVADHSSAHSYWTESFVMQYFGKAVTQMVTYRGA